MPFWASGHSGETKRVEPSSQPVLSERYLTAGINKEVHGCLYQTVRTTSCEPYQFSVTKKKVHHQTCLILEGKYQQWDPMALHPQLSGDNDISWPQKDYQDDPGAKGQRRPISHSLCGFHHLGVEQNSGPVHSMAVAIHRCEHKPRYSTALADMFMGSSCNQPGRSGASPYLKKRGFSFSPAAARPCTLGMRCLTRLQSLKESTGSKNWLIKCPDQLSHDWWVVKAFWQH